MKHYIILLFVCVTLSSQFKLNMFKNLFNSSLFSSLEEDLKNFHGSKHLIEGKQLNIASINTVKDLNNQQELKSAFGIESTNKVFIPNVFLIDASKENDLSSPIGKAWNFSPVYFKSLGKEKSQIQLTLKKYYNTHNSLILVTTYLDKGSKKAKITQNCTDLAVFAIKNNFDGLNLKFYNDLPSEQVELAQIMSDLANCLTKAGSVLYPRNFTLSFEIESEYTKNKELFIKNKIPSLVDFLIVEYEKCIEFKCIFKENKGSSLKELSSFIPAEKLIVAKSLKSAEFGSITPSKFKEIISQAENEHYRGFLVLSDFHETFKE